MKGKNSWSTNEICNEPRFEVAHMHGGSFSKGVYR